MDYKNIPAAIARYFRKPRSLLRSRRSEKSLPSIDLSNSPTRTLVTSANEKRSASLESSNISAQPVERRSGLNSSNANVSDRYELANLNTASEKRSASEGSSNISAQPVKGRDGLNSNIGDVSDRQDIANLHAAVKKMQPNSVEEISRFDLEKQRQKETRIEQKTTETMTSPEKQVVNSNGATYQSNNIEINKHRANIEMVNNDRINQNESKDFKINSNTIDTQDNTDIKATGEENKRDIFSEEQDEDTYRLHVNRNDTSDSKIVNEKSAEEHSDKKESNIENKKGISIEDTDECSIDLLLLNAPERPFLRKMLSSSCSPPPRGHTNVTAVRSSDHCLTGAYRRRRSRTEVTSRSEASKDHEMVDGGVAGSNRHSSCAADYRDRWMRGRRRESRSGEGLIRLSRDPTQPARGSITDMNSQTSINSIESRREEEDFDSYPDSNLVPIARPRAFTCPTTRSFNRRAKAKIMNRPPTPTARDLPSDDPSVMTFPSSASGVETAVAELEVERDE